MQFEPISMLIGAIIGFIIGAAILFSRNRALERRNAELEQVNERFDSLAHEAMRKNSEQFLQMAENKLKETQASAKHDLEKRQQTISQMVEPVNKTLKEMNEKVEKLGQAEAGLKSQIQHMSEDQRLLRQETQNLVSALRNPAARGKWGEMQLQRTLELVGMIEGQHYDQQQVASAEGTKRQPDFVIHMPGGAQVVIDVKTPIEPYWDALESAESEEAQTQAVETFKSHLRGHLKDLSRKEYWRHFESPEFVVMFLPTEGLYSMAVSNDPRLIDDAAKSNIILASPTTVMGLLRVIMHGWHQQAMAEEARTIADLGAELYKRVATFGDHMQKIGRNLNTAVGAYNAAVGSLENSVLPQARKMKDHHIQTGGREIGTQEQVEHTAKDVSRAELTGGDETHDEADTGIEDKRASEG